jgi:GNAT superfamily N-acetyltransferase
MATDLVIRPATAGDTDEILRLVTLSLGEGRIPRHVDFWTWKHAQSPFGPSPMLLAQSDGQLVGLRVFMRWGWNAQGRTWPAVRAVDTATHPDWRGKGIFSRLTLALLEQVKAAGTAFVFNTPNDQSRPGYLKMGWIGVGRTSLWVRPLRPTRLIRSLIASRRGRTLETPASPTRPSAAPSGNVPGSAPAGHLVDQAAFPDFLARRPIQPDRFATPRTSAYIRWRYAAIPGFDYRAIWNLDGDHGAAVIFRRKVERGLQELRLCEVLIGAGSRSRRLGRDLLHDLAENGDADYITAMAATGTPEQRALLRSGFLPAPRIGPVMTVRPLNAVAPAPSPLQRSAWNLSIGDLELF